MINLICGVDDLWGRAPRATLAATLTPTPTSLFSVPVSTPMLPSPIFYPNSETTLTTPSLVPVHSSGDLNRTTLAGTFHTPFTIPKMVLYTVLMLIL